MNYKERENLKKHIEADLKLLAEESWNMNIANKIGNVLKKLEDIQLEGYDD